MAGTFHQAMAYLGLTAEQQEAQAGRRRDEGRQRYREEFADYEEDFYEERDAQLDTHDLGSRRASRAEFAADLEEADYSREEPKSTPLNRVERRLAALPAEDELATESYRDEESDNMAALKLVEAPKKTTENSAPAVYQGTEDESEDQLRQITTIHPRSYNDAKIIGESFRESIPVIMNVTDMGEAEAKRLVDFSAGLAFALHGSIERVTDKVFLLTPANLEVLGAEGAEVPVALDADSASLFNQG